MNLPWSKKSEKSSQEAEIAALARKLVDLKEERENLFNKVMNLEEQAAKKELERRMAEDEIKHMIRLKEERLEVEFEKKSLAADRAHQDEIAKLEREYAQKVEADLKRQLERMGEMYAQILERLPNISAKLGGTLQTNDGG